MKTSKLLIPAILLLSGTMLLASCQPKKGGESGSEETSEPAGQSEEESEPAGPVAVTGVELAVEQNLLVGDTATATVTISPDNAANKNYTLASSNPDVLSVEGNVVTGVAQGRATLTVTTADGNHTASKEVAVESRSSAKFVVKDNKVYFEAKGDLGNVTEDQLSVNANIQKNGNLTDNWWYYRSTTNEFAGVTDAEGKGDAGFAPAYFELNQEKTRYTMGFELNDVISAAGAFLVHWSLTALAENAMRGDLRADKALDYEPLVRNGKIYTIYSNLGVAWGLPCVWIHNVEDNYIENINLEKIGDDVYYVATGHASSTLTNADLEDVTYTLQCNDNFGSSWDMIASDAAAELKEVNAQTGKFRIGIKASGLTAALAKADTLAGGKVVMTTKIGNSAIGLFNKEMKYEVNPNYAPIEADGYRYSFTYTNTYGGPGDTWGIISLTIEKLAA